MATACGTFVLPRATDGTGNAILAPVSRSCHIAQYVMNLSYSAVRLRSIVDGPAPWFHFKRI